MCFFENIPLADGLIVGLEPGGLGFRLDPPYESGIGILKGTRFESQTNN